MGRFRDPQDPLFQALNSSIVFDYRLAPYDLEQSLAHARMLARSNIIGDDDLELIERGLESVREEIESDSFVVTDDDEDIHMAIERRLTEIIGPGRRQAPHRALAQRPGGHRRRDAGARPQPRGARAAPEADGDAGGAGRAPHGLADARLHAHAARPAGLPLAPPAGVLLEVPPRPPALQLLHDRHGRPAARRRRARRGELRHEPHVRGAGAGLRRHLRELAGRRLEPRLRARLPRRRPPPAPPTSRSSAARSCSGPPRSSASARWPTRSRRARA